MTGVQVTNEIGKSEETETLQVRCESFRLSNPVLLENKSKENISVKSWKIVGGLKFRFRKTIQCMKTLFTAPQTFLL